MSQLSYNKTIANTACVLVVGTLLFSSATFSYGFTSKLHEIPYKDVNVILTSNGIQPKYLVDPYPESNDFREKVQYFIPSLTDKEVDLLLLSKSWEEIVKERREDLIDILQKN